MSDAGPKHDAIRLAIARLRDRAETSPSLEDAHTRAIAIGKIATDEFASSAKMSAEYFCKFVMRRLEEGADFERIALELNDPGRTLKFTASTLGNLFKQVFDNLSVENTCWLEIEPAAPEIPPDLSVRISTPAGTAGEDTPFSKVKDWVGGRFHLAGRIARMAADVRAGRRSEAASDAGGHSAVGENSVRSIREEFLSFEQNFKMSPQWFCQFVEDRLSDGANFSMISQELDDPRRATKFTDRNVEALYRDLSGKLSRGNRDWREDGLDLPLVPPKTLVRTISAAQMPSAPEMCPLKDWNVNTELLASRVNRLKRPDRVPTTGNASTSSDEEYDHAAYRMPG